MESCFELCHLSNNSCNYIGLNLSWFGCWTMKFVIPKEIENELKKKGGWDGVKNNLPTEEIKIVEKVMKTLADEKRLKILYALYNQRMCVCMLADLTKCAYSKCSYHISKLKEVGLIKSSRKGNYIIYSLTKFGRSIVRHFNKYKPEEVIK
ncbi:MAG TPA: ArsR family transcriptional regulator [Thermoplasmatales archaeon]|nr:ArsR family transcriptional regulator [Thermoplasmatales archaeon]